MSDVSTERRHGLDYELADEVHANTSHAHEGAGRPVADDDSRSRARTGDDGHGTGRRGCAARRAASPTTSRCWSRPSCCRSCARRRCAAIEERYYGRVARTIVFDHGPGEIPFLEDMLSEIDLSLPDDRGHRRLHVPARADPRANGSRSTSSGCSSSRSSSSTSRVPATSSTACTWACSRPIARSPRPQRRTRRDTNRARRPSPPPHRTDSDSTITSCSGRASSRTSETACRLSPTRGWHPRSLATRS